MHKRPEQLLLAFLGEFVVDREERPIKSSLLIYLLNNFDIPEATTRATLARMLKRNLLKKERFGKEIAYVLTDASRQLLSEAGTRVHSPTPFLPDGDGWTIVTFRLPESQRHLRHQIRAALTWEGFGLMRDGLWIAPGYVGVSRTLAPFASHGRTLAISVFRAWETTDFANQAELAELWDLDEIRRAHREFIGEWENSEPSIKPASQLSSLVADWLQLLRVDPRLPPDLLGDDWLADRSTELFTRLHAAMLPAGRKAFSDLMEFGPLKS